MAKGDRRRGRKHPDDYRVTLGKHRFDPAETAAAAPARARRKRKRAGGPRDEHAGPPPPDPADTRLVQFTQPLTGPDIERIRNDYGLALTVYVPNHTYVEAVDADTEDRLKNDSLVRAIAPYLPEYKLSGGVDDLDLPMPEGIAPGQVLLDAMLFDGGSTERVVEAVEAAGGHDVRVIDDRGIGGRARVRFVVDDRAVVAGLAAVHDIRWIEPVGRPKADNVAATSVIQSGDAGNASIWAKGLHGEGQIIGVMDSGPVDINHCFFADPVLNDAGVGHRKVVSIRNASSDFATGHSTFVGGCAAGDDMNGSGAHARRGGAWAAKLASANHNDITGAATLLSELNAAMANGVFIHSNSWHNVSGTEHQASVYDQTCADVDTFTWTNENHIVLGSSGNAGEEQGPPGTAKNAVCVSAAQAGANAMNLGDGNPGPTADGRRKPDLVAVGCGIESATVNTACTTGPRSACATSYATPHASAAAALIRQYFTEGWYPTGEKVVANALVPTGALLTAMLINSTVDMTGVNDYPNLREGWGLLRLDRALYFSGGLRELSVWDVRHANGPSTGDKRTHQFEVVTATEQLKVVLVYRDPAPASGSFNVPFVNDLDLRITTPDGATTYVGNAFTNGVSTPNSASPGDALHNVEVVIVDNPPIGKWTIEVEAFLVAVGNPGQGYAIAATATRKSSCFVAGAVYADSDHPDVETLRAWRDEHLAGTGVRRSVMAALSAAYRVVGPSAARVVERHPRLKRFLRERVFPRLVAAIRRRTVNR